MTNIIINGGRTLQGTLPIFGAKNACLPIICATALAQEKVTLSNIPDLSDIELLLGLLEEIGCQTSFCKEKRVVEVTPNLEKTELSQRANKMRASILMIAPLLARKGNAKIPYPGGCSIGGRPIDITLDGLRALGVIFEDSDEYLIASAEKLKACEFTLKFPSVGATEALIMAASLAEGTTVFHNVAREPEITDTLDFLNSLGADMFFSDENSITINGVESLGSCQHKVIPDRIITGTYAVIGALCAGEDGILIKDCQPKHLQAELSVLQQAGVKMDVKEDSIFIPQQDKNYIGVDFETSVYNGFATDLQAPIMMFLTQCEGEAHVTENIYENRFMHVPHLNNMGAKITPVSHHLAAVRGKTALHGATVESTDLRGSAALVIAGLIAEGQTVVEKVQHLDRGYETLDKFLANIGADIKRGSVL